jgi:misacylated tRNA(Ala) deacylase
LETATVPLYLSDMQCREFAATATAVAERAVCLDQTAFYPGGGGLPSDRGSLAHEGGEVAVMGLRDDGGRVWHDLDAAPPPVGALVTGRLDWPFRYGVMRHHTAIHVLCGVVYHLFGAVVTGGQIRTDRARIDLTLADLTRERVQQIEDEANRMIAEGRPIKIYTVPRESLATMDLVRTKQLLVPEHVREVRVVEIEGFDAQADGGTHVSTTRECGRLRIVKTENKGKQNKRLEIALEGDTGGR